MNCYPNIGLSVAIPPAPLGFLLKDGWVAAVAAAPHLRLNFVIQFDYPGQSLLAMPWV